MVSRFESKYFRGLAEESYHSRIVNLRLFEKKDTKVNWFYHARGSMIAAAKAQLLVGFSQISLSSRLFIRGRNEEGGAMWDI